MKMKKISGMIVAAFMAANLVGCGTILPYKNGNGVGIENDFGKNQLNIYKVTQNKEENKLNVVVTNPLSSKVNLTFNSTQEYEFVLYKDGKQVYKWSEDKAFGKMIVKKEIGPKKSLEYSIDLSSLGLKDGEYKYEFYLVANEMKNVAPKTGNITIGKKTNGGNAGIAYFPLKYALKSQDAKKLVVEVKNQNEKPMTLTYSSGQTFDIKLYRVGKHVYTWSQDKNFIQLFTEKTLIQGGSEVYEVNLEELTLPKGEYDYEFYSVAKELSNTPYLKGKVTIK
jgi:hypothetical protein